jgi:hypothetical protein
MMFEPGQSTDGMKIFTSEDVELPRQAVVKYLDSVSITICARYLEYIIAERQEEIPDFHDRLAVIYLDMTLAAKRKNDESEFCLGN